MGAQQADGHGDLPSGYDYTRELHSYRDAASTLWRAVQRDEMCDLFECTHKLSGSCHCIGTFLTLAFEATAIATEAGTAETGTGETPE